MGLTMSLRLAISLLFMATSMPAFSQTAATGFPDKPIKIVVGFAAGGPTDIVARSIADFAGRNLGQPVIVENKPGANTIIAADIVASAQPDGYTLLAAATNHTMIPALYQDKIKFNAVSSFAPLCTVASSPTVLVVGPAFKVDTLKAFLDDVRSKPGVRTYATPGTGSGGHFATESFARLANLKMNHIPYKGAAPAMNDLMAGQVDLSFATLASVLPMIKSGKLKALAVAAPKRSAFLPDVPTFEESGIKGYSADAWYGVMAPAGIQDNVRSKLQNTLEQNAKDAKTVERLSSLGLEPQSICGNAFAQLLKTEVEFNLKLAKELDLKME
ncbi:tripartite tricarboxylate transporter substrate binding protein [Orrella sp. NBD-18]|uniref:Tripartite tricarboxylate transporter substrate binding protein n=2 Tax=Sheuella amnicola TaxID=2707330 RepID=A0A6B2R0X8_9BURK|nr:tripartite tricarboxylate transporter substrate binding protein [Sheuella amnicola]